MNTDNHGKKRRVFRAEAQRTQRRKIKKKREEVFSQRAQSTQRKNSHKKAQKPQKGSPNLANFFIAVHAVILL